MHFKSVLSIVALFSYSMLVVAAPIERRSNVVDLVERDYEEDLRARFDDLILDDLFIRNEQTTTSTGSAGELKMLYGKEFDSRRQPPVQRRDDLGGRSLVSW